MYGRKFQTKFNEKTLNGKKYSTEFESENSKTALICCTLFLNPSRIRNLSVEMWATLRNHGLRIVSIVRFKFVCMCFFFFFKDVATVNERRSKSQLCCTFDGALDRRFALALTRSSFLLFDPSCAGFHPKHTQIHTHTQTALGIWKKVKFR